MRNPLRSIALGTLLLLAGGLGAGVHAASAHPPLDVLYASEKSRCG